MFSVGQIIYFKEVIDNIYNKENRYGFCIYKGVIRSIRPIDRGHYEYVVYSGGKEHTIYHVNNHHIAATVEDLKQKILAHFAEHLDKMPVLERP